MNRSNLSKHKNMHMRLRLVSRRITDVGQELPEIDDSWIVEGASEEGLEMRNLRTHHNLRLTPDHIHEYRTDPQDPMAGFLLLNSQIFLRGSSIQLEPLDPRGGATHVPFSQPTAIHPTTTYPLHAASNVLSREEIEILVAAADEGDVFLFTADQVGEWVAAGSRDFMDEADAAVAGTYLDALRRLLARGLVRYVSGSLYQLTGEGFKLAREFKAQQYT